MIRCMVMTAGLLSVSMLWAQRSDPNNKYLVYTNNVIVDLANNSDPTKVDSTSTEKKDTTAADFINSHFSYKSLCDWKPGMRFMVIPDKKDMVIRTFTDASSGNKVSSMSLRYEIMKYKGHTEGELHDRIYFVLEKDSTKSYYYEIPSASFHDYCNTKFGVPTLAYLGDVDAARKYLIGKTLRTNYEIYNVDINTTSYGYDKVKIPLNTPVTVVAVGVGTRQFPVKMIVEANEGELKGKEFFQTVAISRTNSGLRDDEFEEDNVKHTFLGSFKMPADIIKENKQYDRFKGKGVVTLYDTEMKARGGATETIPKMTKFVIVQVQAHPNTNDVTFTLESTNGKEYTKRVTFARESVVGDIAGQREDFYYSLFASDNLGKSKRVRDENLQYIQKSIVKPGFNEAEVRMALGDPNEKRVSSNGTYDWIYKSALDGSKNRIITFNKKNEVKTIKP